MNLPTAEIKSKIDIVEFISQFVVLKQSGRNFKGLCPFHNEKSPSFVVSPDRQIWHCFGSCGEGGDVIKFLMKRENLSFMESLSELARIANVKLENSNFNDEEWNQKEELYSINQTASKYFSYLLLKTEFGKEALQYLESRKINTKIMQTFQLGYAPQSWDSLINYFSKKNIGSDKLFSAGLVVKSEKGGYYDRFRNRLMFTIKDVRGNIVGFSGRSLDKNAKIAKYVNTPETAIYHKRENLYGLDITKEAIRKNNNAYIVEGEFDLITPYQNGIDNIVAIKGSALTPDQLTVLKRLTNKITLALDADSAGIEAMKRGIFEAEKKEFEVHIVNFTKGKDPDESASLDLISFKRDLENAVPIYDFLLKTLKQKYTGDTAFDRKKIADELAPFISNIENPIVKSYYQKELARVLDVGVESIIKLINNKNRKNYYSRNIVEATQKNVTRETMLPKYLLSIILQTKKPQEMVDKLYKFIDHEDFNIPSLKHVSELFYDYINHSEGNEYAFQSFLNTLPAQLQSVADEIFLFASSVTGFDDERIWDVIFEFKQSSLKQKITELSKSDNKDFEEKIKEYSRQLKKINKKEIEKEFKT